MSERIAALIVAAGVGQRFGGAIPKVFVPLLGRPLLLWAVRAFRRHPEIGRTVLVVAPNYVAQAATLCASEEPLLIVPGGAIRRQSVLYGLRALEAEPPDFVAIHDGARPLVTAELISRNLAVAKAHGAAITALPATDTVKRVVVGRGEETKEQIAGGGADKANGALQIVETLDRRAIYLAQTPQTFRYEEIRAAHEQAEAEGWEATDDAVLLERLGKPLYVSLGEAQNLKITTPGDLRQAEAWLRRTGELRVGQGFDLHRLSAGRKLRLGGVEIPYPQGLVGHSDGDAALHAIIDALLGAAALGDIGQHFPDTDPTWAGANSLELLRRTTALLEEAGWQPINIDVTIIAQEPRLAPYIAAMREQTARVLGLAAEVVSYKAKTMEHIGAIGAGEAIAAQAIALLGRWAR